MTHPLNRKKPQRASVTIDVDGEDPIVLTFRAISRKAWNDLLTECVPTDEQRAEYRQLQLDRGTPLGRIQDIAWNKDTFPPALTAACSVDPIITDAQAAELWDPENEAWTDAELEEVFAALLVLNQHAKHIHLGKELAEMLASGRN